MFKGLKGIRINKDGTVDCLEGIMIGDNVIDDKGHFKVKFGKVKGGFYCGGFRKLKSLEGSPRETDFFRCNGTSIRSLKGAPEKIGGSITARKGFCKQLISKYGKDKEILYSFKDGYVDTYKG